MSDRGMQIAKIDEDEQLVFGWASVSEDEHGLLVDSEGDVIEPHELEQAAYDYVLHARAGGELHEGGPIGRMVESLVMTKEKAEAMGIEAPLTGWWIGMKIDDAEAFAKVKSGEYSMFSIEGTAMPEMVEGEAAYLRHPEPAAKAGSTINVVPDITIEQQPIVVNVDSPRVTRQVVRDPETRQITEIREVPAA